MLMMLYLTGASSSIAKSEEMPQTDPMKSLGGYISTSPVPNGALNALFDLVSMRTIKEKTKETIAIALVNKFNYSVSDVTLKIVSTQDSVCKFRIAAVEVGDDYLMEHINNRYSEPLFAEFHDATFYRGFVDVTIIKSGVKGEEVVFDPFNITAEIEESGIEGTFKAINKAFSKSEEYRVIRLTQKTFRIERQDDKLIEEPFECSFISTEDADFSFSDKFTNKADNEVLISDELKPGKAIGIWLQREVIDYVEKTDEELIEDYDKHRQLKTVEEVDLSINYNIVESSQDDENN